MRYLYLPIFAVLFGYMLFSAYNEVKNKTIAEFNAQQMILAKQAAKGIESFFKNYFRGLTYLSEIEEIAFFSGLGKELMRTYYTNNSVEIRAITRVDAYGRIVYTIPYVEKAINADISYQDHVRTIMRTHQPVVSDVFTAVQGYTAVAYHVPVFKNEVYRGSLAVLIPFKNLTKEYLDDIRIGKSGGAWVLSQKGIELYSPEPDHIGKPAIENHSKSPSTTAMLKEMMKGKQGITTYNSFQTRGEKTHTIKKHAAYYPIRLGNTFWSIVVDTPEREVISIMRGFRNRLFWVAGLLLADGLMYAYFVIKAWAILKEAKKRKIAEDALRESENRFRTLTNNLNVGVYRNTVGAEGKFIEANPAIVKLFGYDSREEFLQVSVSDLYQNPDGRYNFNEKMSENEAVMNTEEQLRKKDGTPFIASVSAVAVKDKKNEVKYYDGVIEDVTERKLFEAALQESEKRYRNILESIEEGYFEVDLTGNFTFANDALCKNIGYSKEEALGMNNRDYTSPETAKNMYQIFNQVYKTGISAKISEYEIIAKNGEIKLFEMSTSLMRDSDQNPVGFRGLIRNITERKAAEAEKKKLEAQLQQAQKMEAVGTLAGGIAHDFNNLLMGIQGRISLMSMDIETSHPHADHLKGVEDYVKSASNLTKQLLGFARGGKYEVKIVDLNDFIQNQNRMFARTSKEINIREEFEKNLWTTAVDQGQIEQVLLNMYLNAWQAMPGGGELYIHTENVIIDESYVQPFEIKPGKYVKISITDTGVGMDAETRQRIFEPFYTTKEMGRGTGLGLASVYGIIKNHGGFINVYSEKGEGTTFTIYLPASDKTPVKEKHPPRAMLEGTETVLLVDDEDMIIDVGREIIEKLGYTVLIATGGKEAVDIYKKNADKIDIVVLDMIMPGMSGGEAYDSLKEINPHIKVLLSSGYSINGQAAEILERGCDGFIQKPISIMDLSIRLREILDKK